MDRGARKELLRRKQLAKFRFKAVCRMVILNAYWLSVIEDTTMGSNPRRNINIIVRRSGKTGILTLKEKSIFNKPNKYRTVEEKDHLKSLVNSLKCFEILPPHIRDGLVEVCRFLYISPQRAILREGHSSFALYFILDGEINEVGKVVDEVQYALVPGDIFGVDGLIIGNKRTVTCKTAIHTELLYVAKENLSDELRRSIEILWGHIRTSLKRFDYYFGHFTEQQIIECCTFSRIRQYELDSVVYDEEKKKGNTTFFLLSGQCSILQYLKMKYKIINYRKHFTLLNVRGNGTDNKAEKNFSKAAPSSNATNPIESEDAKITSTEGENEMLEEAFVDVATLSAGSIFGLGEAITNRSIVAKNVVQCLEIPRFWLLQREQNVGNIWQRTKIFYDTTIPSCELVFDDFVRSFKWNQYKDGTISKLRRFKSKL